MNSSHNETHVAASLDRIRVVFEKASTIIEELKPGEKITATGLAEQLASEIGMKGPSLYPTLKWLYEDYPGVKVTRGARGGITKLPSVTSNTIQSNATKVVSVSTPVGNVDTKPPSEAD